MGIRAIAICPGITGPPMLREALNRTTRSGGRARGPAAPVQRVFRLRPMMWQKPFCSWSCDDSSGVTGTTLVIDAGIIWTAAEWETRRNIQDQHPSSREVQDPNLKTKLPAPQYDAVIDCGILSLALVISLDVGCWRWMFCMDFLRALKTCSPLLIIQIPAHGFRECLLELVDRGPAELFLNLGGVDATGGRGRTIFDEGDEFARTAP